MEAVKLRFHVGQVKVDQVKADLVKADLVRDPNASDLVSLYQAVSCAVSGQAQQLMGYSS